MKRNDSSERLMHLTWLATTAYCTALHDIGFDAEEIAEVMPDAMKALGDEIVRRCFPIFPGPMLRMLPGDAIKAGQDYAERLAASRAGVQA
jgi:hypothetical protein